MDILYRRDKSERKITEKQLSELVGGSCISSIHSTVLKGSKNLIEGMVIKTADSFYVEIGASANQDIYVTDFGDSDILPIDILKGYEGSAFVIENRIRTLRQLYATIFLLETDQAAKIPPEAETDPSFDIERKLLSKKDQLQFRSIGFGSLSVLLNS